MSARPRPKTRSARRNPPPRIKNQLVRRSLTKGQNPAVRKIAEAFNTADIHSRRALLQHAAVFAGTVNDTIARELGKVAPHVTIRAVAAKRAMGVIPPAGLVAAFAMANMENATPIAALGAAQRAYPPARQIIDLLQGRADDKGNQDLVIANVIEGACVAFHGEVYDNAETHPQLMSDTGFDIGFAVCWLLLMAVNGREAAR